MRMSGMARYESIIKYLVARGPEFRVQLAVLQNTLEQSVLAALSYICLATVDSGSLTCLLPPAAAMFMVLDAIVLQSSIAEVVDAMLLEVLLFDGLFFVTAPRRRHCASLSRMLTLE